MPKAMGSLDTGHQILRDHVVRAGGLHLAVHILQNCPDELDHSNDEAAKSNGAQMVPADSCHTPWDSGELSGTQ